MLTRSTAFKINIRDVIEGDFIKPESKWEPSYVVTPSNERVSRVRVLASVVSRFEGENGNYIFIVLDDGTGTMAVRAFGEDMALLRDVGVGDIVDVVGKIREYQEERYIAPEFSKEIEDPNWELVRKLELLLAKNHKNENKKDPIQVEGVQAPAVTEEVVATKKGTDEGGAILKTEKIGKKKTAEAEKEGDAKEEKKEKPEILRLIKELDDDAGVKYVTLLRESKLDEEHLEAVLNELMQDGDIYEPKIGRFKIV